MFSVEGRHRFEYKRSDLSTDVGCFTIFYCISVSSLSSCWACLKIALLFCISGMVYLILIFQGLGGLLHRPGLYYNHIAWLYAVSHLCRYSCNKCSNTEYADWYLHTISYHPSHHACKTGTCTVSIHRVCVTLQGEEGGIKTTYYFGAPRTGGSPIGEILFPVSVLEKLQLERKPAECRVDFIVLHCFWLKFNEVVTYLVREAKLISKEIMYSGLSMLLTLLRKLLLSNYIKFALPVTKFETLSSIPES